MSMTVLLGFSALVVDMGMVYSTRAELQRAADAAAISAALKLGDYSGGSGMTAARLAAQESLNANRVLNGTIRLDDDDVVFGRAFLNPSGKYTFTAGQNAPNAVRIRVRRTDGSANGPVPLYFANIFGMRKVNLGARAAAVLTPRDIAFVLDLSSSHNDDSSLRSYKKTAIDNAEVWKHLKDGNLVPQTDTQGFRSMVTVSSNGNGTSKVTIQLTSDTSSTTRALSHVVFGLPAGAQAMAASTAASTRAYPVSTGTDPTTGVSGLKFDGQTLGENAAAQNETYSFNIPDQCLQQMTVATKAGTASDTSVKYNLAPGPLFGNMNSWGTADTGPGWDFAGDTGLVKLIKGSNWTLTAAYASQSLQNKGLGAYNAAEMTAINKSTYDGTTAGYCRRVRVALGLDRWKSGKTGGQAGGNGDDRIDANEIESLVPYPGSVSNPVSGCKQVGGNWDDFIDYVVASTSSMSRYDPGNDYYGDPGLRYRFGLKTWIDYLQEEQEGTAVSPGLNGAPSQPMGAVADAVRTSLDIIRTLEGDDQVGMAGYGTVGYGPAEKPGNMSWLIGDTDLLKSRVDVLQAGMWTPNTNIAQGIDKGVAVLRSSPGARANAAKVLLLLTDGNANQTRATPSTYDEVRAKSDARQAATDAHALGIQIHTISVGACADTALMGEIARIGGGQAMQATGDIASYQQQLKDIFEKLGAMRPVILIE
jgi:hypothetical protein